MRPNTEGVKILLRLTSLLSEHLIRRHTVTDVFGPIPFQLCLSKLETYLWSGLGHIADPPRYFSFK
ncbi:hypothetical protein E2C01_054495 [Portunus trituberculatus]|uniref:Uncharacterized protein n=1 Tax=Portunus trituberculatus TaxID=210409 RepID=A0A5B7GJQ6_PORTR|nr:hypothetical protein [Portunus trituberculatus]